MFILRKIYPSGLETTCEIGSRYQYAHKGESPEAYAQMTEGFDPKNQEGIYGVLSDEKERKHFISIDEKCYIMSEAGATFAKL